MNSPLNDDFRFWNVVLLYQKLKKNKNVNVVRSLIWIWSVATVVSWSANKIQGMGIISQIGPSEKPPTEHLQVTAQKLLTQDPGKIHPKGNSTCLTVLLYTNHLILSGVNTVLGWKITIYTNETFKPPRHVY